MYPHRINLQDKTYSEIEEPDLELCRVHPISKSIAYPSSQYFHRKVDMSLKNG